MVEGLQRVHSTNQLFNTSTHTIDSISAAMDSLKGVLTSPRPRVLKSVFWENLKNSCKTLNQISTQLQDQDEMQPLIRSARESLRLLGQTSDDLFNALNIEDRRQRMDALKLDLMVASQYQLEAIDAIRKFQILAKKESDLSFEQVYWQRNIPYYTGFFLGLLFFFAFWSLGSQLIRALKKSVQGLITATDVVASGQLSFQSPILRNDEFGKVTHAFNQMVSRLFQHEKEAQAHVQTEKERLEFLINSSIVMNRSLQFEETLHQVVVSAIPYLAECAVLDVLEEGDRIRRVKAVHVNEKMQPFVSFIEKSGPTSLSSRSIISEALSSGETCIVPEFLKSGEFSYSSPSREHLGALNALDVYSGMVIPIKVRGKTRGALTLLNSSGGRRFGEKDRLIAEDFVRRAASAIENATLYRESQEALKTRDEFLMIASHELKTPLTPLKLQLQSIERVLKKCSDGSNLSPDFSSEHFTSEKLKKMIDMSNRMVKRFTILIEDLLDVSRINAGKFLLRTEEFDFVKLLNEVADRFAGELAKNHCELSLVTPDQLEGEWDASRMEQVLVNLLSNSMRYGAGKPIEVKLERFEFEVLLSVKDYGIGISEKDQSRIFQRFERASPSSHYGGLGLGLFITSQIMELHGGSITVKSEPGRGSLFQAKFPLRVSLQDNLPCLPVSPITGLSCVTSHKLPVQERGARD